MKSERKEFIYMKIDILAVKVTLKKQKDIWFAGLVFRWDKTEDRPKDTWKKIRFCFFYGQLSKKSSTGYNVGELCPSCCTLPNARS